MHTPHQKHGEILKWIGTTEGYISEFRNYSKSEGQNKLRHAIQKTGVTLKVFNESFSWWKHDVESSLLSKAEKLNKVLHGLHSKLELEYNSKE